MNTPITENTLSRTEKITLLIAAFNETPFHKHIGLSFEYSHKQELTARFTKQDYLVGNIKRKMLHGGLLSSVFDALGGVLCSILLVDIYQNLDNRTALRKLNRLCTLDLSIKYHKPAKAQMFSAQAELISHDQSVFLISMTMHDENGIMIASAHANYAH